MVKFKEALSNFIYSDYYLLFLAINSFLGWLLQHTLGFPGYYISLSIVIAFSLTSLFLAKDIYPYIPLALDSFYIIDAPSISFNIYPAYLFITIGVLIISMLGIVIYRKINIFKGELLVPTIIFVAYFLVRSYIDAKNLPSIAYYFLPLVLVGYLLVYMFFTTKCVISTREKISKLLLLGGLVTILEMTIVYLMQDNIIELIKIKDPKLYAGWTYSNLAAIQLTISIGSAFYLLTNSKKKSCVILHLFLILALSIGVFFTFSRGFLAILVISVIPYSIFVFKNIDPELKKILSISYIVFGILLLLILIVGNKFVIAFIQRSIQLISEGNFLANRKEKYELGIQYFISSPLSIIFGSGFFSSLIDSTSSGFVLYHEIFIQILTAGGIIGLVIFIYYTLAICRSFINKNSTYGIFVFITFVSLLLISLFDNCFLTINFMVPFFILLNGVEN